MDVEGDDILTAAAQLSALTLQEALVRLVELVGARFPLSRASIRVIEEDRLRIVALWSLKPTNLRVGMTMTRSATSLPDILRRGAPVRSGDSASSLLNDILRTEGIRSWISISLPASAEPVALLSFSSMHDNVFHEDVVPLFAMLGALVEQRLLALLASER